VKKKLRNGLIILLVVIVLFFVVRNVLLKKSDEDTGDIDFRTDASKPRGIRNNNPGNIKINANNNWLEKVPLNNNSDGTFEQFYKYKYGIRAMILILIGYIEKQGRNTITKIVERYTSGDTIEQQANYVMFVSEQTKTGPSATLQATKSTLRGLVKAMTYRENDVEAVTDTQFDEAYKLITA